MTDDAWVIVGALCCLAGASLAVRHLGEQATGRGLAVYLVALAVAGGLGYWVAEDLDHSGPLGLAAAASGATTKREIWPAAYS